MRVALLMLVLIVGCSEKEKKEQPATQPSPQATQEDNDNDGGDNNGSEIIREGVALTEGRQYATDDIAAGKLTLHNCAQGQLYSVNAEGDPVLANPSLTIGSARPDIFVVYASNKCELYLDGMSYAPVQVSMDKENLAKAVTSVGAHDGVVAVHTHAKWTTHEGARLYVSNDAGGTWHKIDKVAAGQRHSHPDVTYRGFIAPDNRSMLMLARDDGSHWWHSQHAPFSLYDILEGFHRNFGIAITGIGKGEGSAAVQIVKDCGMLMFTHEDDRIVELGKDGATEVQHITANAPSTYISFDLAGTPTSLDCRPVVRINGFDFSATIIQKINPFPAAPAIVATNENGKIKISVPSAPDNFGTLRKLYYYGNKDDSSQWHALSEHKWNNEYTTEASTVGKKNRILLNAAYMVGTAIRNRWFYIESKAE